MDPNLADKKKEVVLLLEEAYQCRINNLERSIELATDAHTLSRAIECEQLVGKSLSHMSLFYMIMGEYELSTKMAREAISNFERIDDEKGIADAKYNIAGIYYKTDNLHLGLIYLIECLTTYRKFGDYHSQAKVLKSLGTIYEYFGDVKSAISSYQDSIKAAREAESLNLESNAYNPLSGIYLNQGKIRKATELIEKAIEMKKETGDIRGLAFSLYGRAKIYTKTGDYGQAEDDFNEALRIHHEMGEKLGIGMAYHKLGVLYMEMGELSQAKRMLEKAVEFGTKFNTVLVKFKCNYLLYEVHKREKNTEKALEYLEIYDRDKREVDTTQMIKIIENYEMLAKMETREKEAQLKREKEEIIEKKNIAEQTAKMKQDFLSTMSHEIRTPLNAVITITSLLQDKTDKGDKQLLESLKFSANNLLHIINDILDFTKLDAGKVELEHRPVEFPELLKNIQNTYKSLASEKGLTLGLKVDKTISTAYELDEVKFSQILGNLISNAIKFTQQGRVDVIVERTGEGLYYDELKVIVKDTGEGISKEFQERIFDSFSQPKSVSTRKEGGSGLGLAIVKKLVNLHDSDIYIESEIGKGSSFYFVIKFKKARAPKKITQEISHELKGKKVLVAEDNLVNAMVITKLLSNWGVVTQLVQNGLELINKSQEKRFDFILTDIHMPEMDGFDATKQIRNKKKNPNINTPIFALTADITADQRDEYIEFFDGFLLKPIEKEKLFEALISKS